MVDIGYYSRHNGGTMNGAHMNSAAAHPPLAPCVQAYLGEIAQVCAESENAIVSVILFGSTMSGGFLGTVSDVDLILILRDGASAEEKISLRNHVIDLEAAHGLRPVPHHKPLLNRIMDRITANDRSFFVCTRSGLLSGLPSQILDLHPAQAIFVDRMVIPSILTSAVTFWGEDLLPGVNLLPIRRFDVFKAFFGLFCQALTSAALFPVLPDATRYAMATLKRSVRSCYFCYRSRHDALEEEIDFFQKLSGPSRAFEQLLALRRAYTPSFAFAALCIPAIVRLHLRTAIDNRFQADHR